MVKIDLVRAIAKETGVTQENVEAVLDGFSNVVVNVLTEDHADKVAIPNLGSFKLKHVAEKRGTSKITNGEWVKPAHNEIYFKVSPLVKESIV